jgi:hypothetical protein
MSATFFSFAFVLSQHNSMCLALIRKLYVIFNFLVFFGCVKLILMVEPYLSFRHHQRQLLSIIAIDKPIINPSLVVIQLNFNVTTIKPNRSIIVIVIAIMLISSFKERVQKAFAELSLNNYFLVLM